MLPEEKTALNGFKIGIAYYARDEWMRLRQLFLKDSTLDESYEDWLTGVAKFTQNAVIKGQEIERIWINVDELVKWCKENAYPMNSSSRSEFVVYKMQQLDLLIP